MTEEAHEKRMKLRYEGTCRVCGAFLPAGDQAIYERPTRTVRCVDCVPTVTEPTTDDVPPPVESGVAGASARREHERRKARHEERLRAKWGRLGGIAVAFSDEPQSTRAWQQGAVGEEALGARLDGLIGDSISVLHDRRIPRTRANIDHLVVTLGGVWVVDAKRYKDQRPELRVEGGIIRPRVEKLMVGRRDRTRLVDGVLHQVDLVRAVVDSVPVTGALCFIDADWPLLGGAFATRGVHVVWPKQLTKLLGDAVGLVDVPAVARLLGERFPSA